MRITFKKTQAGWSRRFGTLCEWRANEPVLRNGPSGRPDMPVRHARAPGAREFPFRAIARRGVTTIPIEEFKVVSFEIPIIRSALNSNNHSLVHTDSRSAWKGGRHVASI